MSRRTCRYYATSGFCFYGDRCQFLHEAEVAEQIQAPNLGEEQVGNDAQSELSAHDVSSTSGALYSRKGSNAVGTDVTSAMNELQLGQDVVANGEESHNGGYAVNSVGGPSTVGMASTSMGVIGHPRYDLSADDNDEEAPATLPVMERGTTFFVAMPEKEEEVVGSNIPMSVFPGMPPYVPAQGPMANEGPRSYFASSTITEELIHRQAVSLSQPLPEQEPVFEVDQYKNLFRLEGLDARNGKQFSARFFCFPSNCYKAMSSVDGQPYCLRHVIGYRLSGTASMGLIEKWKKLVHPNICTLRNVFTTKAFGDSSLVFTHDYYAGAQTMQARFFDSLPGGGLEFPFKPSGGGMMAGGTAAAPSSGHTGLLKETLIWNFIVQLASAIRAVHNCGLACRVIHPTKLIITGESRLRLSAVGVNDILTFEIGHTDQSALMAQYQQDDLLALGHLILCLACNSTAASQNLTAGIEVMSKSYGSDLKNIVIYLVTGSGVKSINNIMPMIGARFFSHIDSLTCQKDLLEVELSKLLISLENQRPLEEEGLERFSNMFNVDTELQNGRLFRLLCKFGVINERPEFGMDPHWLETGDRYLLKLFRDYLFHQVSEDGRPWLDVSHVVHCLNQLDAGSPTKICLESRDGNSVIIVSYHDLKQCFEAAFEEVMSGADGTSSHDTLGGVDGQGMAADQGVHYS